ncbi:MAG: hypothetical protein AABZ55_08060 [Bdellovibrionota bacterium]
MLKKYTIILSAFGAVVLFQACGNSGPVPTTLGDFQKPAQLSHEWVRGYEGYWSTEGTIFEILLDGRINVIFSTVIAREFQSTPVKLTNDEGRIYLVTESFCEPRTVCRDHLNGRTHVVSLKSKDLLRLEADGNCSLIETNVSSRIGKVKSMIRRIPRDEWVRVLSQFRGQGRGF